MNIIKLQNSKVNKVHRYLSEYSILGKYDVIHTGVAKHQLFGILMNNVTGNFHIHTLHNANWGLCRGVYPYIFRRVAIANCDQLITVSPFVASKLRESYDISTVYEMPEPTVIPNGVKVDMFRPNISETNPNQIFYLGRNIPRKNLRFVIKLARYLPGIEFRIRIPGLQNSNKVTQTIHNIENIVPLPRLEYRELAKEYSAASVMLAPYEQEGFGMAVIESLASGTPVIGLNSGNLPTLLDHNAGILCDGLSVLTWKNQIKGNDFLSLENEARTKALEYSWDTIADEYEEVYNQHLNGQ